VTAEAIEEIGVGGALFAAIPLSQRAGMSSNYVASLHSAQSRKNSAQSRNLRSVKEHTVAVLWNPCP